MARIAFRWMLVALLAATLFVLMAILLNRARPRQSVVTVTEAAVSSDALALPLDANGLGAQVIERATLSLRLTPFPARAGAQATVTLVAVDRASQALSVITPTLMVAEVSQVDGVEYPMTRQEGGAYLVTDRFFPHAGRWRLRVAVDFGDDEPYSMVTIVQVPD